MNSTLEQPLQNVHRLHDPQSVTEVLVDQGKLGQKELTNIIRLAKKRNEPIANTLVQSGQVSETDLARAWSTFLNIPLLEETNFPTSAIDEQEISVKFLKQNSILPLRATNHVVFAAMANPEDDYTKNALSLLFDKKIEVVVATSTQIQNAIERLYEVNNDSIADIGEEYEDGLDFDTDDIEQLKHLASETPVVRMVNVIINRALELKASDIHIEPFKNTLFVRYRVDGVLKETESPPSRSTAAVISRIKIMAKLNIAERRRPQDGRIQLRVQSKEIDIRVSTVPTLHGESVVMRLLDKEQVTLDFSTLGFDNQTADNFIELLDRPHGIILVTGPTGSGKTTTLYAALEKLNTADKKILTVEDPVEYQLERINQIQANPKVDLTFANALRSIVRQDPDVIMIGEMRDLETASIAVQAALTGHLVFSTLHTNDAASAITRLLDMGVEDYLLTSSINGILAQRLVRKLCNHCKKPVDNQSEAIARFSNYQFDNSNIKFFDPIGCDACDNTGYQGRTVIFEYMPISEEIRQLILAQTDSTTLQQAAMANGMAAIKENGIHKAARGITSIEEVIRVTQDS